MRHTGDEIQDAMEHYDLLRVSGKPRETARHHLFKHSWNRFPIHLWRKSGFDSWLMFLLLVVTVTFESSLERRRGRRVHPGGVRGLPASGNSGMVSPARAASALLMCGGKVGLEFVLLTAGGSRLRDYRSMVDPI